MRSAPRRSVPPRAELRVAPAVSSAPAVLKAIAAIFAASMLAGCGAAGAAGAGAGGHPGAPVTFFFDSLDDRPVSTESTRGQPTLLAFITTSSLPAQAQVDFLVAMARHDADRVHYVAVILADPSGRELAELYRKALGIPFPMALADASTLAGAGAFGDVQSVPVTVILDRAGRVVWRRDGRVVKSDELRGVLRGL
jgi:hypothetical protein